MGGCSAILGLPGGRSLRSSSFSLQASWLWPFAVGRSKGEQWATEGRGAVESRARLGAIT